MAGPACDDRCVTNAITLRRDAISPPGLHLLGSNDRSGGAFARVLKFGAGENLVAVFRLDTLDSHHSSWARSDALGPVWVEATSSEEARNLVATKLGTAGPMPLNGFASMPTSPWLDQAVTSCTVEAGRTHIALGTIVDADGRTLPLD